MKVDLSKLRKKLAAGRSRVERGVLAIVRSHTKCARVGLGSRLAEDLGFGAAELLAVAADFDSAFKVHLTAADLVRADAVGDFVQQIVEGM